MSGCGFLTFDMAASPNSKPASAGLTLQSNVILYYDTDNAVLPQPYMVPFGGEICFGSNSGCEARTTCINGDCAYIFTTQINSPTYLLSLFGDVNTGALSQPYADPPSGAWNSSVDMYIYQNCSAPQPGRNIAGPANYYSQIPADAIHLLTIPMQSHDDEDIVLSVNKSFSTPILLKPGNCLVGLTKFSSLNGGATVNNAIYGLAQLAPFGSLDQANCSTIGGWAGNRNLTYYSDSPVEVHLYADGVGPTRMLGKTTANTTTTKAVCDILNSSQSPCQHGYILNTPESLKDGKPHVIDVYAIDGTDNPKLSGSGKTITCSSSNPGDLNTDGKVDIFDYNLLVSNFGDPYTIFDYNTLVGNFGK